MKEFIYYIFNDTFRFIGFFLILLVIIRFINVQIEMLLEHYQIMKWGHPNNDGDNEDENDEINL